MSTQDWHARAASLKLDVRPVVDGERVDPLTDACFTETNPADGKTLARLPDGGQGDVDRAVAAAHRAFQDGRWSALAPDVRARVLRRLADLVQSHAPELALLDSLEMGMPIALGVPDLEAAAEDLRDVASWCDRLEAVQLAAPPTVIALNRRVPHGVVAAITPWNFPVYVALGKIAPALAAGNSVVLKPSEVASLGCLRLGDLALEAGVPAGVLNVITGRGAGAGAALAAHPQVDALTFTGSTQTGQRIMALAAASNLKALMLECGGKSPQIVLDDLGDPEGLADALVSGFTWNSGQVCVAGTRILLHRDVQARLWPLLAERVSALQTGHPLEASTTLGPLASATQHSRVSHWVALAEREAWVRARGVAAEGPCHMAPLLLRDVPPDHPLMQEEIFGPVAGVCVFGDAQQALQIANGTRYGLSATVWTADAARGARLAQGLRAGSVTVNTVASPDSTRVVGRAAEPVGLSGFGAEGGLPGLMAYTRQHHLTLNLG